MIYLHKMLWGHISPRSLAQRQVSRHTLRCALLLPANLKVNCYYYNGSTVKVTVTVFTTTYKLITGTRKVGNSQLFLLYLSNGWNVDKTCHFVHTVENNKLLPANSNKHLLSGNGVTNRQTYKVKALKCV